MPSRLQFVFWLDAILLVSVCALETVPFTGMFVHEWLGLALIGMIVIHLLLSWTWIVSGTRRFTAPRGHRTRINYLLNWCLFLCMTAVIFSGVRISQEAVPALTGTKPPDYNGPAFPWDSIHDKAADLVVVFVSLHLAMNWSWAAAALRKMLGRRPVSQP